MEVLGVFALIALGYGIRELVQRRRDKRPAGSGSGGGGRPYDPSIREDVR